jgi:hypothetical protein
MSLSTYDGESELGLRSGLCAGVAASKVVLSGGLVLPEKACEVVLLHGRRGGGGASIGGAVLIEGVGLPEEARQVGLVFLFLN